MSYVRIINKNECPIEGITKLGVSTSRGNSEKIGQFGSGVKMGVLCLLRHGIQPTIYSGTTKIEYFARKSEFDGNVYHPVYISINGKKPQETSLTLEYGAIDWTSPDMGLREFVSNAIDQGKYKIDIVEQTRGKSGYTTIYIPNIDEVENYVAQLSNRFLHFNVLVENEPNKILGKLQHNTPPKAFRKGVFVRNFGRIPSLFDYNFGENLRIDDCRNSDEFSCQWEAAKLLSHSTRHIPMFIKALIENKEIAEKYFPTNSFETIKINDKIRQNWLDMWRTNFENAVMVSNGAHPAIVEQIQRKGYKTIFIEDAKWFDAFEKIGIPTYLSVDSGVGPKNTIFSDVIPEETIAFFDKIWNTLEKANLTFYREKPNLRLYTQYMNGGVGTTGFYLSDCETVCINEENQNHLQTYLEEFAHHITKSLDETRDFQDFAFRMAARFFDLYEHSK